MGSRGVDRYEEPIHRVEITQSFYLGTYPVTQAQFAIWRPEHKCGFPGRPNNPVEEVDWHEANEFCQWLNDKFRDQFPANYSAGLPTEAQWEYACRAGTDTEYYVGDGDAALTTAGWYDGNSNRETQPVGRLKENAFGLFDMHGNVWEWCADAWDEAAYKKRVNGVCDPLVVGHDNAYRVLRGGSWNVSPGVCRAAYRGGWWPDNRDWIQGFRVCLFLGPSPSQTGQAEQASVGKATRDEEAKPQRDREAGEFFDDFDKARFPSR